MSNFPDLKDLVLFEDSHIIVCIKPSGIATQSKSLRTPDMVTLLKNHLSRQVAGRPGNSLYLAVIHRLDQPVSGILVFAKTPAAARELNRQIQNHEFGKYYRALLEKTPPKQQGILENYIVKDSKTNTSRICSRNTPGAKYAKLEYFVWGRGIFENSPSPNEVEVSLFTGRHHQIRVQFAHIGCPIVGDTKYNPDAVPISSGGSSSRQRLCLCACRLEFVHPATGKKLSFVLDRLPESVF